MTARLRVVRLGRRRYAEVLDLQRRLAAARAGGDLPDDVLLLVEHEPVITLGRGTRASSLPLPVGQLEARGVEVHEAERGGDVTWHGPGQLVGYPILHLSRHREDLHWYLRQLEAALIEAMGSLGIRAGQNPGLTGVWVDGRKLASIGIHVRRWVTYHGFALNVHGALDGFGLIVPCGIPGVVMTSVRAELAHAELLQRADAELWDECSRSVVGAMGRVFSLEPSDTTPEWLRARALEPSAT